MALMFLLNLIKFHIELKHKGLTTYEFLKMKENLPNASKIVIKVDKELREQMKQEEEERIALKKEQAALRKKLESAALKEVMGGDF